MAGNNLTRLRYDALTCTGSKPTLGASLTSGATSITFPSALQQYGSNIPTLTADQYIALVIAPVGDPASATQTEVVWLTAYTAGATTGTIARGKDGSSGQAHNNAEPFITAPTASFDYALLALGATQELWGSCR